MEEKDHRIFFQLDRFLFNFAPRHRSHPRCRSRRRSSSADARSRASSPRAPGDPSVDLTFFVAEEIRDGIDVVVVAVVVDGQQKEKKVNDVAVPFFVLFFLFFFTKRAF